MTIEEVKAFVQAQAAKQQILSEYLLTPTMLDRLIDFSYSAGHAAGFREGGEHVLSKLDSGLGAEKAVA